MPITGRVLFFGDSITIWATGYPALFDADHPNLDVLIDGVGGSAINTGANSFMSRQAAAVALDAEVLVVLPGANDLSDSATYPTTADWMTALYNFTDPFRAAGAEVWIILPTPQGTSYPGSATHNSRRAPVRTTLLADIGVKIDGVIDLDGTPLGPNSAGDDTSLIGDGIHPTDAGHLVIYGEVFPTVRAAVGLGDWSPGEWIGPSGQDGGYWDLSDLSTLFQDTAAATPVTTTGDPLGRINDLSGNGYHFLQATAGSKPTYRTNGGAGGNRPYADFDGGDYMQTASFTSKAQPHHIAIAAKLDSVAGNNELNDGISNGNRASLIGIATDFYLQAGQGYDTTLNLDTNDVVIAGTFNGGASIGYKDGAASPSGNAGANPLTGLTWGSSFVPNTFMDGRCYRKIACFGWLPNSRVRGYMKDWLAAGFQAVAGTDNLTVSNFSTGSPSIGVPVANYIRNLSVNNFSVGSPSNGPLTFGQQHTLSSAGLTTSSPSWQPVTLGQKHTLNITNVSTASPEIGTPSLAPAGTISFTIPAVELASPSIGSVGITQKNSFSITAFTAGSPTNGTCTLGQRHWFTIPSVNVAQPDVGSPSLSYPDVILKRANVLAADHEWPTLSADYEIRHQSADIETELVL